MKRYGAIFDDFEITEKKLYLKSAFHSYKSILAAKSWSTLLCTILSLQNQICTK